MEIPSPIPMNIRTNKQIQTGTVVCACNPSAGEADSRVLSACRLGCPADLVRCRFRGDLKKKKKKRVIAGL